LARGIPSEVIRHFQAIPLFESLSRKGLRTIIQAATEVDVSSGKILVREGGYDRDLYVITRGEARVTMGGRKLSILGPGDFFGELALLDRARRSATVTAATDMRVMILGPADMEAVLKREPVLATYLLEAMAKRVRQNERSLQH